MWKKFEEKYFIAEPWKKSFQRSITSWNYFVEVLGVLGIMFEGCHNFWELLFKLKCNIWAYLSQKKKLVLHKLFEILRYTMFTNIFTI